MSASRQNHACTLCTFEPHAGGGINDGMPGSEAIIWLDGPGPQQDRGRVSAAVANLIDELRYSRFERMDFSLRTG